MATRLTLLIAVNLILLFLSAIAFQTSASIAFSFSLIFFLISLSVTLYYIMGDAEFNLSGNFLLVDRPFHGELKKYDLNKLRQWEETSYNIRGQQRRTLLLTFDENNTVELLNRDHKERYETLINYLKKEFFLIEKFNMSLLQEIKFDEIHNFLITDFYSSGNKYYQVNEVKSKSFSIQVFKMKLEGASRDLMAEVLLKIKTKGMGESEVFARCKQIADRVIEM